MAERRFEAEARILAFRLRARNQYGYSLSVQQARAEIGDALRRVRQGWERLNCARCGEEQPVLVPTGNPNMEVCGPCHVQVALGLCQPAAPPESAGGGE